MKILYYHQFFAVPKGGGGTRSYEFAKRLVKSGHDVTIVCGSIKTSTTGLSGPFVKGRRTGVVDGINLIELDIPVANRTAFLPRAMSYLKFGFRSIGIALTAKYDVLFATTTPLTAGLPGIFAKIFRRKRFVFEVRDLWPELPRALGVIKNPILLNAMSLLEWASYKCADRCIALSPGIKEGILHRGIPEARVALVPNSCDLDVFDVPSEPFEWPDEIKKDDFVAIFTGTHGLANGLDGVLDAAAVLKKRGRTDIKFVFLGDGNQKDGLVERANRDGLDNCVFMKPVPKTKLVSALHSADVGLMVLKNVPAFYYGTSPNKFFDYLASSMPILNNYPGWLAGMIEEHRCGVVVPPENPEAMADALTHLADHREDLPAMGQNSRRLANEFDRDRLYTTFETTIREAADGR
jgi:glycosyltransferase involved in cell wall biosynthesis